MSYFTQIRSSQGYPGTILDSAEPLFDSSNNIFYIGTEIGSAPIPYYPYAHKSTLTCGRGVATFNVTSYMKVGDANFSSGTGFLMINNGTITGASAQNSNVLTSPRTIEIRINDSSINKTSITIPSGSSGVNVNNLNLDVSAGNILQVVCISGSAGSNLLDVIATIEISKK